MIKKLIRGMSIGLLFISLTAMNVFSMSIGPIYFNQRIDGSGGYQEYEIDNPTFQIKRYKIEVIPDTQNPQMKNQMGKWVDVYPKVLNIQPKSIGKVKVLIKAPPGTKSGEYSFILVPTPITIPTLDNEKEKSELATVGINAPLHFSMVLNGYVGDLGNIHKDMKVEEFKDSNGLKIRITNKMKREVALDIIVTDSQTRYRDLIRVKAGKVYEKTYRNARKLEIKEAPTQIEIKTI